MVYIMIKQTARRDQLGGFADEFANIMMIYYLGRFGQERKKLSLRERSMITIAALMEKKEVYIDE